MSSASSRIHAPTPCRTPLISDRPKHASLLEGACLKFVERGALPYQISGDRSRPNKRGPLPLHSAVSNLTHAQLWRYATEPDMFLTVSTCFLDNFSSESRSLKIVSLDATHTLLRTDLYAKQLTKWSSHNCGGNGRIPINGVGRLPKHNATIQPDCRRQARFEWNLAN